MLLKFKERAVAKIKALETQLSYLKDDAKSDLFGSIRVSKNRCRSSMRQSYNIEKQFRKAVPNLMKYNHLQDLIKFESGLDTKSPNTKKNQSDEKET